MGNQIRRCVFCNKELTCKQKSVEHIIPQWLLKELDIEKSVIEPTHMSSTDLSIVSQRVHTTDHLVSGNICSECNNGWMSKLEDENKKLLCDLMSVKREVKDLSDNERLGLARWTYKTALTLNSGTNYHKNIPSQHYHEFYSNSSTLPIGVVCLGQQHHENEVFNWLQWPIWSVHRLNIDEIVDKEFKEKCYKISFQFKSLILSVVYMCIKGFIPLIEKGIHLPLYPKSGRCGWYENNDFSWNDSIKAIYEFHIGIKAIEINNKRC